jgi:RimJ/RimL family protein N-acetyltransferase
VVRWLTTDIPYPYTLHNAEAWITKALSRPLPENFAIEVNGAVAGAINLFPFKGDQRGGAMLGYWLGRAYWGRGIASEAVSLLSAYALRERGLRRLEAYVFAPNVVSARVLEKCGFTREAVLRRALIDRQDNVVDGLLYVRLDSDAPLTHAPRGG